MSVEPVEQSLWNWKQKQPRLDVHTALMQRCRAAFASSGAGIGILQTKGQAFVFAKPSFELCRRCQSAHVLEFTGTGDESMWLANSAVCKERNAQLTRKLSTAVKVKLKRVWCRRPHVTLQWMSVEPVEQALCAWKQKQPRLDVHTGLLQRCRAASASSGAGIGILQTKGQAFVFARPSFELCWRCQSAHVLEFTGTGTESMWLTNSTVCKERTAHLTRNLSTAFEVELKRLWCRRPHVTLQWTSLEPVQSKPCALESKSSPGWMFILSFCRDFAQHAQAAALGLASYRPRVKLWFVGTGNRTFPALPECFMSLFSECC